MSIKLLIDYAAHPAFRALVPDRRCLDEARRYFEAVDEAWSAALAGAGSGDEVLRRFDEVQAREMSRLREALVSWVSADYLPHVLGALDTAAEAVRNEIRQVRLVRRSESGLSRNATSILDSLRASGVAGAQMAPSHVARLNEALGPLRREVSEQRRTNGGARCFVAPAATGEHWDIMKSFVREQGVEDAISAYAGYRLELEGYALTYSHPEEDWYRKCYSDLGLGAPRTVQMHYDEDNLSSKSMFYLDDVDESNGPFSYVACSRSEIASRSQLMFFKYLDYANNAFAATRHTPATSYNRPLFIHPSLRKEFARLPAEMQGSGGPGDDVLDGTPLSDFLCASERRLTGPAGYLALFAGGETLHRGGVVTSGERWALQMIYKRPPSAARRIGLRLRSLAGTLRNLPKRLAGN